jgi:uncharacterized protein YutE (UPF0331/DUF86 family)/predicted nucleotidyltransferase
MDRVGELVELLKGYYEEFVAAYRDYLAGRERIYAVERLAQLVAQVLLDIAALLAARERGVKPSSYRELAAWLSTRLGLGDEQRRFLVGLAGFRNVLVRMYAELNRELEEEAFREIERRVPRILERLVEVAGDPCIDDVREGLLRAARKVGARYVLIFGSLAREGCGNDVDVAVKLGRRPRSMIDVGWVQAVFEDEVGARVDLVILDLDVPPHLAKTIVDEAVVVYGDRDEAIGDLARIYSLYLDHEVFAEKLRRLGP